MLCSSRRSVESCTGLDDEGEDVNSNTKTLSIIDLGFGCGDQCLYFKDIFGKQRQQKGDTQWKGQLKAYVGITLENSHFSIAQDRLQLEPSTAGAVFTVHCGYAGRPGSWTPDIRDSVSQACRAEDENGSHENWLLGLDTLYHFQPSRWSIIEYASKELEASLMAFDLCVAEDLSMWQRIMLRVIAFFGQSPFANWVTIEEYRERLIQAGYARESVEIRDISEHVFGPLAGFMKKREVELQQYGMSIGRFRYAASMFGWWGRTGMVRGCIIVARK